MLARAAWMLRTVRSVLASSTKMISKGCTAASTSTISRASGATLSASSRTGITIDRIRDASTVARGSCMARRVATGRVAVVHEHVVERDCHREQIREHADRIVPAPDEVAQQQNAAEHAHGPEQAGKNRTAVSASRGHLHQPATGEQEYAEVADQLPRRDDDVEQFGDWCVHRASRPLPTDDWLDGCSRRNQSR